MQTLKVAQLFALIFITVNTALAQGSTPQPSPSPTPTVAAQPATSPLQPILPTKPRVIAKIGDVELDDIVEVNVENLEDWAQTNDPSKLVPYINGRAITGNYPEELHIERGRLIYHLEVTPDNKRVWIDLLGAPTSMRKTATLSVGLENGSAFDSKLDRSNPVTMTVISPVYGLIALLVIVVTLALLIWLVRKTNIIREPGPPPVSGKRRPYNLGRAQMAFWFFLVYSSYMAIWLIDRKSVV